MRSATPKRSRTSTVVRHIVRTSERIQSEQEHTTNALALYTRTTSAKDSASRFDSFNCIATLTTIRYKSRKQQRASDERDRDKQKRNKMTRYLLFAFSSQRASAECWLDAETHTYTHTTQHKSNADVTKETQWRSSRKSKRKQKKTFSTSDSPALHRNATAASQR